LPFRSGIRYIGSCAVAESRADNIHYQVYHKYSTNGGVNWGTDTKLTTNFTSAFLHTTMAVLGSGVHAVWTDNRDGNFEIYYAGSKDGGTSWGPETRLTNNSSVSAYPFVSSSGNAIHMLWQDMRDGNYELYYKRNPTNSEVGLNELNSSGLDFSVFPNPARNEIKVRSRENLNELTITNVFGQVVYHSNELNSGQELRIPTSDLTAGIYFIKSRKGEKISVQKFIKQ
jgi:hypothetical protein